MEESKNPAELPQARNSVRTHFDLEVYRKAFNASMHLFELTKQFPKEETYSLTDQIRRSSRSVCANLAECWRKRIYKASFVAKIVECEGEAAETQTWIQYAVTCGYLDRSTGAEIFSVYDEVIRMLVAMRSNPDKWCFNPRKSPR